MIIENMAFSPAELRVRRGDRVRFVNRDLFAHTATETTGRFDSRSIEPRGSWSWVAAEGRWPYRCTLHPTMRGLLVVE